MKYMERAALLGMPFFLCTAMVVFLEFEGLICLVGHECPVVCRYSAAY